MHSSYDITIGVFVFGIEDLDHVEGCGEGLVWTAEQSLDYLG